MIRRMRLPIATIVTALLATLALTGCSTPPTAGEAAGLKPIPTIAADHERDVIAKLYAIDPLLEHPRNLERLRATCGDIRDGVAADALAEKSLARITGGTFENPTVEQAQAFVDLARAEVCPTW